MNWKPTIRPRRALPVLALAVTALVLATATQSQAARATGGTITYVGGYTIHTFTSSGTFTPSVAMNVEVLVVALVD